ncbi:MAG TPA: PKD domain-containing protein, partial [Bacteroidia bacterium]|nr:PKD domain-containing protein [Bacteroidia bacterium]
ISTNEWTWMAGPNITNDLGSYGTIMVSSPSNNPPSRGETNASWTDSNNCLWLFGGTGSGNFSDLWKFDISTNQWTWMKGPNIPNQPATYGILNVPDPANNPGARYAYSKWKDSNGNFWLFGGATSQFHYINDLWRFNPNTNEWTWMGGPNVFNDSVGVRGIECNPSINNLPCTRFETRACWTRSCDNFEFFGGQNYVNFASVPSYNDLWNYNVNTNEWTWISGSSIPNDTGNYGTILVSSSTNMPPSRYGAIGWTDTAGNLWLFGSIAYRNDMWRFVPDTTCPAIGAPVTVTSAFTAQPFSGCDSLTVSFSNTSVNGTSYNWNFGDTTYNNAINPTHTFTSSGTYLVQLIANAGCAIHPDTSTQTITVFSNPTPSITGNISFCQGDSSTLNAGSFAQYHWSTGSSTQSISVDTSSIYSVTVTNSNGCTGTASQTITVNPNPTPVIIGDSSICSGDSFLLDAGSFPQYLWSTGSTNETITVNITNTYIVTVTNGFGCTGTTSKAVTVNPYSQADFVTYDTIGCTPYTVNYVNLSTNAASYLWYFGNNDSSTYTSPSYVYHTSGLYTVTLIAYGAGGCNDTLVRSDYITVGSTMDTIHLSFTMSPTSGCDSLTVHFQNTTLAGTYWLWNFGDGHTDTMQSPVHTYDSTGIFHVELSCYYHTLCGTFYPPSVYS